MKPYAMVLPSTAFFGSSVGNFFVKSFNTGEAYLLLLLVFAFVMTYGLGYLIMCKISPKYKETMNPPLEQVQVQKSDDKGEVEDAEDGEAEDVEDDVEENDDEDEDDVEDESDDQGEDVIIAAREDEKLLEQTGDGGVLKSDRLDTLRKRNASLKKTAQPATALDEDEEEEMVISPLLEDETEPKKNK